jgi:hypothetical protein
MLCRPLKANFSIPTFIFLGAAIMSVWMSAAYFAASTAAAQSATSHGSEIARRV